MTWLDQIWDQLFPAEQQCIVRLLVENVIVSPQDIEVRLRQTGMENLALELLPVGTGGGCRMSLTRITKTGEPQVIHTGDGRLTISVPIQIKRRSGRKVVTLPSGAEPPMDGDPTPLQLALARGHRWLALLESGEVKSLREIAQKEGVDSSYVSRMVNLTTLAPDIIAAIFDETLPPELTLFELAVEPPALWEEQRGPVDWTSEDRIASIRNSRNRKLLLLTTSGLEVSRNSLTYMFPLVGQRISISRKPCKLITQANMCANCLC